VGLAEVCDQYLATNQHQKPKTRERKELVIRRMKEDWPSGGQTQIVKIKPSQCDQWLSRYKLGPVSRNQHIRVAKAVFGMAVRDRIIPKSPAEHLKGSKIPRPLRITPTWGQWEAEFLRLSQVDWN